MSGQGGTLAMAATVIKAVKRLPTPQRVAAIVIVIVTVLGLTLGVLGWMKPVTQLEKANPEPGQTMTFAYSAKVPPTAAYDGTTVTSPDPIFRKVTDKVNLRASYQGHPGMFGLTADLSDGSGWHTSIQLLPARSFTGTDHAETVPLDLAAWQERAVAAAKVIGVQPSAVKVEITARVAAVGHEPFVASLALNLNQIALSLAAGVDSLSVKDAGPPESGRRVVRVISIFGHSVLTAIQARSYAVLLLLVALVGAGLIGLLALRHLPLRTRAEIERRYPQLLVHVEPMPSPPGKPVVNVDNFPALAKLAERYGQMVLTWRRPDADDFIVRDEGITYRYRVPLEEPTLQNVELIGRPGAGSHRRKTTSPTQVS